MKVSERLLQKALPIWENYYTHPFVRGIADGTLPVEKFEASGIIVGGSRLPQGLKYPFCA